MSRLSLITAQSKSLEDTFALGERLAQTSQAGDVITLSGDLGAGKTHLVKGIARGLGVDGWKYVNSPTFTLLSQYTGRLPLVHIDLYRLDGEEAALDIGLDEILEGESLSVIEWPERCPNLWRHLPGWDVQITIPDASTDARAFTFAPRHLEGSVVTGLGDLFRHHEEPMTGAQHDTNR